MGTPAVFLTPHPDDETLSMGAAIAYHVERGRDVHVVSVARGESSGARRMINADDGFGGPVYSGYWYSAHPESGGFHDPVAEGYGRLSVEEFADARVVELTAACADLGVPASNVHVLLDPSGARYDDGYASTVESGPIWEGAVRAVIWSLRNDPVLAALPAPISWKTMTAYDTSAAHAAIGAALHALRRDPRFADARYYVKVNDRPALSRNRYVLAAGYRADNASECARLTAQRAALQYARWSPPYGRFAIGYHSVYDDFLDLERDATCWVHDNR